jgi:anti-sigma B factor antagonist
MSFQQPALALTRVTPVRPATIADIVRRKAGSAAFASNTPEGGLMHKIALVIGLILSVAQGAAADITCTPTKTVPQQNRTRMKHRNPPSSSSIPAVTTVTAMIAISPADGTSTTGFRTAVGPIDPRENAVVILKGDLWQINIEPNDCDFHLEISEVGGTAASDRVIVEIPQTARFTAARNAFLQGLHAAGVTLHSRTTLAHPIRVQVLGFMFFDAWHFSATNHRGNSHGSPQVDSIWEVHPVWGIIFPGT